MTYVIVGNSAAGISAAEAIRSIDSLGDIVIISEEKLLPYRRYLIPRYLEGAVSPEEMRLGPKSFYQDLNITTFLGEKVIKIEEKNKRVYLDNGEYITYGKLLIASGADPYIPCIKGYNFSTAIYTLRSFKDAQEIIKSARQTERAAVIGGGIVGIQCAFALLKRYLKVTVITSSDQILTGILDRKASELFREALNNLNLEWIFEDEVEAFVPHPFQKKIIGIGLRSGKEITCQMAVLDRGIEPNIGMIQGTGIKVKRGIVVSSKMETTVPLIFAAGDVTEAKDMVFGDFCHNTGWSNAVSQGWTAGHNMTGVCKEHPGTIRISRLETGLSVFSVGLIDPESKEYEIHTKINSKGSVYRKLVLKDGLIYGALFLGNTKESGTVLDLIKNRVKLNNSKVMAILKG